MKVHYILLSLFAPAISILDVDVVFTFCRTSYTQIGWTKSSIDDRFLSNRANSTSINFPITPESIRSFDQPPYTRHILGAIGSSITSSIMSHKAVKYESNSHGKMELVLGECGDEEQNVGGRVSQLIRIPMLGAFNAPSMGILTRTKLVLELFAVSSPLEHRTSWFLKSAVFHL